MNNLFALFIGMALINNFVLTKFLGLCPFFGVSKKLSSAVSMGMAVILVMTAASAVTWILFFQILIPFGVEYMSTVIFILVIASLVQIIELTIRRTNLELYNALGIYLPLITTNCAVLGVTFINARSGFTFIETLVSALGAGTGFTLVLAIMSGIRERLDIADVPESFEGIPVAFLVAMMLGIAFIAFGGMV
ncbi:MAG: RnfABCDGE type electron transport complex subunit A [Thermoplasmata archaeon]